MVVDKHESFLEETHSEMNDDFLNQSIEEEQDDYQVLEEDFSNKEGNYIFTVGNVSSGKSTLQNLMIYRLWSKDDINFEYGHHSNDHRQKALLSNWVDAFRKGILPPRTKQGLIQEFNISISQKRKKPLDLNFIEISGEDIKSIVPSLDSSTKPSVHNFLDRYLTESNNINKRFIFVSNGEEHQRGNKTNDNLSEDILFDSFLRYLLSDSQKGLKKLNILFVIAKWDTVREDYKNDYKKYLKDNFPQTLSILDGERVTVMYLPFTVGKIEEQLVDKDNHVYENRIVRLENAYVDRLIQWTYNTFTGEVLNNFPPIKPSLLYRIAKSLGIR